MPADAAATTRPGYAVIGEALTGLGSSHLFGVMGNGNLPFVGYLVAQGKLRYLAARHEAGAVNMAAGYARASGNLGLATVTHGPGLTNTATALTAAVRDRVELLLLVGEISAADPGSAQHFDHRGLVQLTGAGFHSAAGLEKLATTIGKAAAAARLEQRPQVVSLPVDFFEAPVELAEAPLLGLQKQMAPRSRPAPAAVAAAVDALARAERPALLAGRGAVQSGARPILEALADEVGAIVATSMLANGFFAGNEYSVGLSGGWSSSLARDLLAEADCVIAFGAALNKYTSRGFGQYRGAYVIQCDRDVNAVSALHPVDLALIGDAAETARAILQQWRRRGLGRRVGYRTEEVRDRIAGFVPFQLAQDQSGECGLDPRTVLHLLDQALPPDRVVVTDGGRFAAAIPSLLCVQDARGFVFASGFASVGLGLATAIGVAVGQPERPVVLVAGDGGFMMSLDELDSAVRSGARLLVIVMNDGAYGAELGHLANLGLPLEAAHFDSPDLAEVARAMGGSGELVRTKDDLQAAYAGLDGRTGVHLLDIRIGGSIGLS